MSQGPWVAASDGVAGPTTAPARTTAIAAPVASSDRRVFRPEVPGIAHQLLRIYVSANIARYDERGTVHVAGLMRLPECCRAFKRRNRNGPQAGGFARLRFIGV